MNLQPGRQLAALIEKEGVGIADDPQRIKAHLLDSSPESRTEIELLVAGATDGLASRLARSSETVFRDGEIARAIADLKRTRRLDQQAADWVVRSWAWALGVTDTEPSDEEPSGDTDNGTSPPSQGSAYTDQSGAPPQYETGPTSTPSSQPEALASSPQYGEPGSAPPYGQQTTPPSWPGSSPPAGTPSGPPWGHVASAPPQSAPSAPPLQSPSSQPPYETTRPVWEASRPYGPSAPYSESGPYGKPSPYGQQWSELPSPDFGGAGGIPPAGPAAAEHRSPNRRRTLVISLVAAAVLLVAGAVLGVVRLTKSNDSHDTVARTTTQPTPSPTPSPTPTQVSLQISDTLDAQLETLEAVSVRYGGQEIGTVEVSTLSPTAVLPLTAPPGPVTVELSVNVGYVDGTNDVCTGQVTIQAYQGADYLVGWSHSGSSCVASLSEQPSQS